MIADRRIRTLIVDDSAVVRQLLHRTLTQAGDFVVVDAVSDGERATARVARLRPDLVTMDLHLPGLNGLEATREIMRRSPTAIAVVAASASLDDATIFEALEAGALTAVRRPLAPGQPGYLARRRELLAEFRAAVRAHQASGARSGQSTLDRRTGGAEAPVFQLLPSREWAPAPTVSPPHGSIAPLGARVELIAVAASTGGPHALRALLASLANEDCPPVVVVQHIADGFTPGLATWLCTASRASVRLANHGDRLVRGEVLVAPEQRHLRVTREGIVQLAASPPVGGHRPSADVLFQSVAEAYGPRALGIVLTGMGRDGAEGLLALRQARGRTIVEDPSTAVVGGMPGSAIELGAAGAVYPLAVIGPAVVRMLRAATGAQGDVS